jgi:intergrase/recombinase
VLAKFLGTHNDFRKRLKDYGVKLSRPDAFASFMRIYNNHSSDLAKWYIEAMMALRDNEKLWLRFLSQTGMRKEEAIISFNKVMELAKEGRLSDYYNEELSVLEHFRFKELFLRGTKNVYVSIVPKSLVAEVASTQPVSYAVIRKRLKSNNLSCRMNELRDYFGTYMIKHGLIKEEVDLLQGRIPPSIFLRHYWSPSFRELRDRTLEATKQLEKVLTKIMKTEALTTRVKYLEGKGW